MSLKHIIYTTLVFCLALMGCGEIDYDQYQGSLGSRGTVDTTIVLEEPIPEVESFYYTDTFQYKIVGEEVEQGDFHVTISEENLYLWQRPDTLGEYVQLLGMEATVPIRPGLDRELWLCKNTLESAFPLDQYYNVEFYIISGAEGMSLLQLVIYLDCDDDVTVFSKTFNPYYNGASNHADSTTIES